MERKLGDRWLWRQVEPERRHLDTHRSRSCTEKQQALRRLSLKAAVSGCAIRPAMCKEILRFPEGKPSIEDWMVHDGRFQRFQSRRMHMAACHRFIQRLLPQAISNWRSCVEAKGMSRRGELCWLWQSWPLVLLLGLTGSLRVQKALWHPRLWDTENMA